MTVTTFAPSPTFGKVALIGRQLADNENLGLGYLAAALAQAGISCRRFALNQASDLGPIGEQILRDKFGLVGLSIPDGGSAYLPLTMGELLRRRGFDKPITCGGSFATLARHWLLERYPWLHSVVRFAGELPLVRLAQALRDGGQVGDVPGLTTRQGDGVPAAILDQTPLALRPQRDELPGILGYPAAHIMATRGCAGRCGYCAPAALQQQEQKDGLAAGVGIAAMKQAGVGRVRRRTVDSLCGEMAELWHERGVRYFYFVDEHMLPYEEAAALDYLDELERGLRRRRVGRLGIGTMLRVDRLSKAIVRKFAEVGLVRAFIGVEFASDAEARRFGRTLNPGHAHEILCECEAAGVVAISHLMMIHPDSTTASLEAAIRFLETVPSGLFEVSEMRVYHGTNLWRRLSAKGELQGNPLRWGYQMSDPTVARFYEIFMRLRAEAFWNHSVAYRTHDAFLAYALGRRLRPDLTPIGAPSDLGKMAAIRTQVQDLYVASYRKALALAQVGIGGMDAGALVREARAQSLQLQESLDEVVEGLARRLHTSPRIFSPSRAAAAAAITFAMLGTGCASGSRAGHRDAGADAVRGAQDTDSISFTLPDSSCPPALESEQASQIQDAALRAASCFSGDIWFSEPGGLQVVPSLTSLGADVLYVDCAQQDAGPGLSDRMADWATQVKNAVAGLDHTCLAQPGHISVPVEGGSHTQLQQILDARARCDTEHVGGSLVLVLDANGALVGVSGTPAEVSSCMLAALNGLTFPCLSGSRICEEYICIE